MKKHPAGAKEKLLMTSFTARTLRFYLSRVIFVSTQRAPRQSYPGSGKLHRQGPIFLQDSRR